MLSPPTELISVEDLVELGDLIRKSGLHSYGAWVVKTEVEPSPIPSDDGSFVTNWCGNGAWVLKPELQSAAVEATACT